MGVAWNLRIRARHAYFPRRGLYLWRLLSYGCSFLRDVAGMQPDFGAGSTAGAPEHNDSSGFFMPNSAQTRPRAYITRCASQGQIVREVGRVWAGKKTVSGGNLLGVADDLLPLAGLQFDPLIL